jgi:hypothetical protein
MIDHVWSIICSNSIIDKDSNNISINNVFERLEIFTTPVEGGVLPIHMEFITSWIRHEVAESETGNSRIRFVSPSNKMLTTNELRIDLSKSERTRNRLVFNGLPLGESGRYHFLVDLQIDNEWQQVASIPLSVKFTPPPEDEKEKAKVRREEA